MFKNGQKPYLSVFVCFLLFAFALAQILPSSPDCGTAGPASAFAKERKEQSYKHTGSSSRHPGKGAVPAVPGMRTEAAGRAAGKA